MAKLDRHLYPEYLLSSFLVVYIRQPYFTSLFSLIQENKFTGLFFMCNAYTHINNWFALSAPFGIRTKIKIKTANQIIIENVIKY